MRTLTLLTGLLLATALVSLAPSAAASDPLGKCVGDPVAEVCVPDRCQFQSDCCAYASFWCPEDS